MKRWSLLLALVGIGLLMAGCATTPAPAPGGAVPPPQEIETNTAPDAPGAGGQEGPTFAEAYAEMGRPTMIVFATRKYTGRVNEWRLSERAELDMDAVASEESDEAEGDVAVTAELTGTAMTAEPRQEETFTDDELLFERSYVTALLKAGVKVVDRDVILRQEALRHQDVDATTQTVLSESVVESYALENHVEWIITVDLLGDPEAPCGQRRFLAQVKSLDDGAVLATADSEQTRSGAGYVATAEGYQRTEGKDVDCAELAGDLARRTLETLTERMEP